MRLQLLNMIQAQGNCEHSKNSAGVIEICKVLGCISLFAGCLE
jgi:hypothetical protein